MSVDSVRRHWAERGVDGLIGAMERCEPWAVDMRSELAADAERVVSEICAAFDSASAQLVRDSILGEASADAIELMGFLRCGRSLALFAWLGELDPEVAKSLIREARFGGDEYGAILVERIATLERQRLLSRVFSPQRIALTLELLEEAGLSSA